MSVWRPVGLGVLVAVLARGAAAQAPAAGPSAPALAPGAGGDPALALASIDRGLADLTVEERASQTEMSRLTGEVAVTHQRVVGHGRLYYRLTRAGLLPIGGGFSALVTHAMRVERAHRLVAGDLREEQRLHARAEDLQQQLERMGRDRVALTAQRQALDTARLANEEESRRQAAFDEAFQKSTGAAAEYVAVNGGLASESPAGGFATARGRLLFPVLARADVRPARRAGADGPGLEIHAPAGSVVRAVFAARVAFADRYGPYGRIVILDHGDHYYTVSGNLDAIDVKIGQDVAAGDRIGTVGDDGSGAMLYFEVRHGSRGIAPEPWLGL